MNTIVYAQTQIYPVTSSSWIIASKNLYIVEYIIAKTHTFLTMRPLPSQPHGVWCYWLHILNGKLMVVLRCLKYVGIVYLMPTCFETWKQDVFCFKIYISSYSIIVLAMSQFDFIKLSSKKKLPLHIDACQFSIS